MKITKKKGGSKVAPKPSEIRQMPAAKRDALLKAAARVAAQEYQNNPALTDFEAFGKDDLYGDSGNAQTR